MKFLHMIQGYSGVLNPSFQRRGPLANFKGGVFPQEKNQREGYLTWLFKGRSATSSSSDEELLLDEEREEMEWLSSTQGLPFR